MTDVYWLEQFEADVPVQNDWLCPGEIHRLTDLRFAKRRADWRLGRWTAKRAVSECLGLPQAPQALAEIEIRAGSSGAPEVLLRNQPAYLSVSLSHRSGRAVCAVARSTVALGCDVEEVEPRSEAFVADYFSAQEQALVAQSRAEDRARLVALLWSAKESALKALHAGLRLDTRSVVVNLEDAPPGFASWRPLEVRHIEGNVFHGWWQLVGNFLWTVVSAPPPRPPVSLPKIAYPQREAARCA
jgi:4'-phosphopantetheinyl transferase